MLDTCQKCLGWTIEGHSFLQANVQSLAVWEAEATLCSVCFGVDAFGIDPPTVVDFKLPLWLGAGKSFLWCKLSPSTPLASIIFINQKGLLEPCLEKKKFARCLKKRGGLLGKTLSLGHLAET